MHRWQWLPCWLPTAHQGHTYPHTLSHRWCWDSISCPTRLAGAGTADLWIAGQQLENLNYNINQSSKLNNNNKINQYITIMKLLVTNINPGDLCSSKYRRQHKTEWAKMSHKQTQHVHSHPCLNKTGHAKIHYDHATMSFQMYPRHNK